MNLQQAKITLEKINRLYQSITLDSTVDEHEQQLMRSYIRHFYKAFGGDLSDLETPPSKPAYEKPTVTPPTEKAAPVHIRPERTPPPPVVTRQPAPKPEPKPEIVKAVEVPVPEPVRTATPPPPRPEPSTPMVQRKDPELEKATMAAAVNDEFDELFEQKEAKELSERLSASPINDLTRAIGINEKILTANELFNKDTERFNTALRKLNTYGSFREARPYLVILAKEYGWAAEKRKKKAQVFIKLVRRRYG